MGLVVYKCVICCKYINICSKKGDASPTYGVARHLPTPFPSTFQHSVYHLHCVPVLSQQSKRIFASHPLALAQRQLTSMASLYLCLLGALGTALGDTQLSHSVVEDTPLSHPAVERGGATCSDDWSCSLGGE